MSIKCFYHSGDLDGWCSGAIVKYKFPEAELFPINYGDAFPWDEIKKDDIVYMVDFSLKPLEMDKLARFLGLKDCRASDNFFWFDHHKGIIEDMEALKILPNGCWIRGYRQTGVAACELTWRYLFGSVVPDHIRLLSLYDVWQHNDVDFDWDNYIEPFQYGCKYKAKDPSRDWTFWNKFFGFSQSRPKEVLDFIHYLLDFGFPIKSYVEDRFESTLETKSLTIDWEGYKCLVVNSDPYIANYMTRSQAFKGCDIAINFVNVKNQYWVVNLRAVSECIDLSVLAKKYGGGGHRLSAGFISNTLPFVR
jgi:oligoribonuclease NrnB/cAMP/cGMP phosphodiesterase (DHH superfamily)